MYFIQKTLSMSFTMLTWHYTMLTAFTKSKERQQIARNLVARGKLSEDPRFEREVNQVWQVMMKLMSNYEVNKLNMHSEVNK